ncbi:hypothetical protein VPNG_03375 [Cytospora leucostoma]|uniref:DUF7137 domain-containing protein n=1 Tax=Cytospora leucostoma TaxID=1230097 RepID=A0A423XFS2_9PEZI|nr:hypothetical protein VPNG_03375 [Cytospora leucostoma]
MKAAHFTTALLSLTPVASAIAWPQWLPDLDTLVVRRADASSSSSSAKAKATATTDAASATNLNTAGITATSDSGTASGTATDKASGTGTATDDASGTVTGTGTATGTGKDKDSSSTSSHNTSTVSVSSGAEVASVVMLTPITTLTSAYYRIGEYVTFGWNYTNLEVTPTAVDVAISCTTATETWTLTSNMTFHTKGSFTWDSGAYQSSNVAQPLLVEEYILYIYDADSSISATAGAGSLTANPAVTFGLYTGQPYSPLESWVCATCSGAMSNSEKQALGFLFTVAAITVASFTWFVTGI